MSRRDAAPVSLHLRVLSSARLVVGVPDGNRRVYRLEPRGVEALRAYLDRFWPRAPAAFRAEVERPPNHSRSIMSTQSAAPVVSTAIVVQAPIERAFEVFTTGIGSWWPPESHILEADLAEMVFEPRVGGHIYDVGVDGSESHWARVLTYEPPQRLVFSWDIDTCWRLETDPAKTSEVEVRFVAETPERTRVELEHRGIERHGEGWEGMHAAVGSPNGWNGGLQAFARRLAA